MLYGCGDNLWVPLLGMWGAISYAPLLVRRQYLSTQFIPATHGLNLLEFDYRTTGYVGQIVELAKVWKRHTGLIDKGRLCIRFNPIYLVFCIVYHLFWTF